MRRMFRLSTCSVLALIAIIGFGSVATALINPGFTPVHLTDQSRQILVLKLEPIGEEERVTPQVIEALKGEQKAPVLDLTDMREEILPAFKEQVSGNPGGIVLFFAGDFEDEEADFVEGPGMAAPVDDRADGYMHIHHRWFALWEEDGVWYVTDFDNNMEATWAGSTEMLRRATRYCLEDPDPFVPSVVGAAWEDTDPEYLGTVEGTVHGTIAVDIKNDGTVYLHVLSDEGDRLFVYNAETRRMRDATVEFGLASKSKVAAWGDFDGSGRLDLASWDGDKLTTWLQQDDGTFRSVAAGVDLPVCLGLQVIGVGEEMRAGLIASNHGVPVLLAPAGEGRFTASPIAEADKGADLGQRYACLVADFTGNAIPDVLQPFAEGVVLFRGKSPGEFDDGTVLDNIGTGEGHVTLNTGDYDHDGLLDVFVSTERGPLLWHNRGDGQFAEATGYTGEMRYIAQPHARMGMTVDINNNGRQDVFIAYGNRPPQIFFNRGYLSFGHAHNPIDVEEMNLFPREEDPDTGRMVERENKGQRAGVVHDLDGDGAKDMAIALEDGSVWVYWRSPGAAIPLSVTAALPADGPAGPVTVSAIHQGRPLGAWNVVPGTAPAFFGMDQEGPITLEWRFPGGETQRAEMVVEGGPARKVIRPE